MTRKPLRAIILFAALALVSASAAFAQSTPNLSGTWRLNFDKSGDRIAGNGADVPFPSQMVIAQSPTELTVESTSVRQDPFKAVYKLDGSRVNVAAPEGISETAEARFDGATLVITSRRSWSNPSQVGFSCAGVSLGSPGAAGFCPTCAGGGVAPACDTPAVAGNPAAPAVTQARTNTAAAPRRQADPFGHVSVGSRIIRRPPRVRRSGGSLNRRPRFGTVNGAGTSAPDPGSAVREPSSRSVGFRISACGWRDRAPKAVSRLGVVAAPATRNLPGRPRWTSHPFVKRPCGHVVELRRREFRL